MSPAPRLELGDVIVGDVRQQDVLAEKREDQFQAVFGVLTADNVLTFLRPVPASNIVEPQRRIGGAGLCEICLGLLALDTLYRFRFPPGRAFGRAVKAVTLEPKVEEEVWRMVWPVDGHG